MTPQEPLISYYYKKAFASVPRIKESMFYWNEAQFWKFYGVYYHKCLEYGHRELYLQMEPIMKAPCLAFYSKAKAFELWADLPQIYKYCLKPLVFHEISEYAQLQLYLLYFIPTSLNRNALQCIHSFLYYLSD